MNPKGINFLPLCFQEEEGQKFAERAGSGAPRRSSIPVPPRTGATSSACTAPEPGAPRLECRLDATKYPLPSPGRLLPSCRAQLNPVNTHQRRLILHYSTARLCCGQEETPQQPVYCTGHWGCTTESIFCPPYSSWRLPGTPSPAARRDGLQARGRQRGGDGGVTPADPMHTERSPEHRWIAAELSHTFPKAKPLGFTAVLRRESCFCPWLPNGDLFPGASATRCHL